MVSYHGLGFIISKHLTGEPLRATEPLESIKACLSVNAQQYCAPQLDPLGTIHTFSIQNSAFPLCTSPFLGFQNVSHPPLQTQPKAICILIHTDYIPSTLAASSPTESTLNFSSFSSPPNATLPPDSGFSRASGHREVKERVKFDKAISVINVLGGG